MARASKKGFRRTTRSILSVTLGLVIYLSLMGWYEGRPDLPEPTSMGHLPQQVQLDLASGAPDTDVFLAGPAHRLLPLCDLRQAIHRDPLVARRLLKGDAEQGWVVIRFTSAEQLLTAHQTHPIPWEEIQVFSAEGQVLRLKLVVALILAAGVTLVAVRGSRPVRR